jgi:hypothetical protein
MTHNEEKIKSIETEWAMTQTIKLVDKSLNKYIPCVQKVERKLWV